MGKDNWVGYGDEETVAMKEDVANKKCLGGVFSSSVDFDPKSRNSSGGNSAIYNPKKQSGVDNSWKSMECRSKGATDTESGSASERWNWLKADSAWEAAVQDWRARPIKSQNDSFPYHVSELFPRPGRISLRSDLDSQWLSKFCIMYAR